jgi:hypothetical protein
MTPPTPGPPRISTSQVTIDKPSEDQFQIMLSSILAQNSNLLAQNNEQARVIDRLSICLTEAEAGQKELREEMRGVFKSIMDVLGGLKAGHGTGEGGGAGTPVSNATDAGTLTTVNIGLRQGSSTSREMENRDFSGLMGHGGGQGEDQSPEGSFWNLDNGIRKGKEKEVGGVDPNIFQRPTFSGLDTPTDQGQRETMDLNMDMGSWNDQEDMLNSVGRVQRQSYVPTSDGAHEQYGYRRNDRDSTFRYRPTSC